MTTRFVEVFTAGCSICEDIVTLVNSLACSSCDVRTYNMQHASGEGRQKAARYGITTVPSVVVNGQLLDCCRRAPITAATLQAAGIGQA